MRIAVCLVLAASLAAGCMPAPKRHVKPTTSQRAPATTARRPAPLPKQATGATRVTRSPAPATVVQPQPQPATPPPQVAAAQPSARPSAQPATPPAPVTMAAGPDESTEINPNTYRLMPGDGVHIDVFNEPELTVNAGIDATGSINYPLLGHVPAAGMTVREFEQKLTEALRGDYLINPSVRVAIHHFRPIFISGNVRKVGSFPFSPGLTVEKALTMAGGITEYGSTKKIYIQHAGATEDQKEKVNLDMPIKPGDTILVEERLF
jgi:polysaccharide export outer membrane protein